MDETFNILKECIERKNKWGLIVTYQLCNTPPRKNNKTTLSKKFMK